MTVLFPKSLVPPPDIFLKGLSTWELYPDLEIWIQGPHSAEQ